MMLPPIRKSVNGSQTPPAAGFAASTARRHGELGAPSTADKSVRDEPQFASSSLAMDRVQALERENEHMRAELAHFRHHLSNNQQQREDERLSLTKVSDELQRLVLAFNSKLQADSTFQQREQQKGALLFAEVARLGHSVESVEHALKTSSDDARRRFELLEQQLQFASAKQQQPPPSLASVQRSDETQQQVDELQHAVALAKSSLAQLRSEVEAERNERWRVDTERSQWLNELRNAVTTLDASVDGRILQHIERLQSKLSADRIDVVRLLETHRDAAVGADLQRVSSQLLEFARLRDHVLALERWLHIEFALVKRVFQTAGAATDVRLEALARAVAAALQQCAAAAVVQDDVYSERLDDVIVAVRDVAHSVQFQVVALEHAVPAETVARYDGDAKLRARVESSVKALTYALETTRSECVVPLEQLRTRTSAIETAQQVVSARVEAQLAVVDVIRAQLADASERERQPTFEDAAVSPTQSLPMQLLASASESGMTHDAPMPDRLDLPVTAVNDVNRDVAVTVAATETETAAPDRFETFVATQLPIPLAEREDALLRAIDAKLSLATEQQRLAVDELRAWTASHALECGQCYAYLGWAVERASTEMHVSQCVAALVDYVADAAVHDELQALEDSASWALQRVVELQEQQDDERGATAAAATDWLEPYGAVPSTCDDQYDYGTGDSNSSDVVAATDSEQDATTDLWL